MNEFKYPFQTAYTQSRELYGVELAPDEFETIGMIAWGKIGNKQAGLYRIVMEPTKISDGLWTIDLPCNADILEAVTAEFEDWEKTSNQALTYQNDRGWIEQYIERGKLNTNSLYQSGRFIKYRREQNTLYFDQPYKKVFILYKGFIADEEGLPFLTEREVDAVAAFCAYSTDLKAARISKDKSTMEMALFLKQLWERACTRARVPDYINQNEMDEILNVAASWDRKRFGKSYKPIR